MENHSSTDSLNMMLQNQLHEWSRKDKMTSKPEEKCWEPLSKSTPNQESSEEIYASIDVGRNVIHGSDCVESAYKEIALWFKPEEQVSWLDHSEKRI